MSLSYAILFEMLERISMAAVAGTLVLQMAQLRHFLVGGVQNWREQFVCVMIFRSALADCVEQPVAVVLEVFEILTSSLDSHIVMRDRVRAKRVPPCV